MGDVRSFREAAVDLVVKYIVRKFKQGVYQKLASYCLFLAVGLLALPSLLSLLISLVDLLLRDRELNVSAVWQNANEFAWPQMVGFFALLAASFGFARLAHSTAQRSQPNLVQLKQIVEEFKIGSSTVHCYVGDISFITEVDVVVTSENTSLDLGSISGTSVSGRVRKLAANKDSSGEIQKDNLNDFLACWKRDVGKQADFNLGETVFVPNPYSASKNNIKAIILAVAIQKEPQGVSRIDETSIYRIIKSAVKTAVENKYESIFIPVFGLGSGAIDSDVALSATVQGLTSVLRDEIKPLKVYLGVYRESDLIELILKLRPASVFK